LASIRTNYQARQVTVLSGATTATYTFDAYELSQWDNIRPVATPLSNPGSHYWITKTAATVTVNLASAAGADVTFNVHLTPG
jgi:hypothetical protein